MNKEERMYELLKHRYDKKITTVNLFEDIEALLQENEQLKEKVKYQKNKIDNKDNWCQLIADIGFDYDGCNTIESLKGLIDELVRYALNSRDNYDYEEILKGDSLEEENKKYKNQQKEFIKWLEDYLNLFDYRDIDEQAGYDMLEEILQKYKEIIEEPKKIEHCFKSDRFLCDEDEIEHLRTKIDELIDEINNLKGEK